MESKGSYLNRNEKSIGKDQPVHNQWIVGIDFGATQLRAALVSSEGMTSIISTPTPNQGSCTAVWEALSGLIKNLLSQYQGVHPIAICAGVPSVVDSVTGTVYDFQHIPACKQLPLGNLIQENFGLPALVNNDANVFALGEYYFGGKEIVQNLVPQMADEDTTATNLEIRTSTSKSYTAVMAKNKRKSKVGALDGGPDIRIMTKSDQDYRKTGSLVGLTLGTGLGAGLILDGKLYSGRNCGAGEIGCLPYLDGNLEKYVSGAFFKNHGVEGKDCFAMASNGDPTALKLYQEFGHHVGQAIKITMYSYDPDYIVLGGSVSQAFHLFEKTMQLAMQDFDYPGILTRIKVCPSSLKHGAILGAAALYYDQGVKS